MVPRTSFNTYFKRILLLLLCAVQLNFTSFVEEDPYYTAQFIYYFSKYINWPKQSAPKKGIVILGNPEVLQELKSIVSKSALSNNAYFLANKISTLPLDKVNMVYIGEGVSTSLQRSALSFYNEKPVVTISNIAMNLETDIQIAFDKNKPRFYINEKKINDKGLFVANELLQLSAKH